MQKKYLKGFSLADVLISLLIIGILFTLTALNMTGIMADNNTAKFKKAYAALENTTSFLINQEVFYGTLGGFKDTDAVKIENINELLGQNPTSKFRDCFKYYVNAVKDNIPCTLHSGTSATKCFQTDDGIVWGIPDTDFVKKGIITISDPDNSKNNITAVPITIYLDYKDKKSTLKQDAIVAAVVYDGRIKMLKNKDKGGLSVTCHNQSQDPVICKLDKYINATTIKVDDSVK